MFSSLGSIRVSQGVLKVLGTVDKPVILASTNVFLGQYGEYQQSSTANTSAWGGLWLRPQSTTTVVLGAEYISGSVVRHCIIQNAGHASSFSAAVYMDGTTIMLDGVQVLGSGSKGVSIDSSTGSLLVKNTSIRNSADVGLYLTRTEALIALQNVSVTDSGRQGLFMSNCADVRIGGSSFTGNYKSSSSGSQLYTSYCSGFLNITSR